MTEGERRAMGFLAQLTGGFYAVSSVLVTLLLAVWAVFDADFEYVDPIWLWLVITALFSVAASVLGMEAAKRGRQAARHPEEPVRYAVAVFFATLLWVAWSFAANIFFVGFALIVVAFLGGFALVFLLLGRVARAVIDSRR